jgi:hypothetical protein
MFDEHIYGDSKQMTMQQDFTKGFIEVSKKISLMLLTMATTSYAVSFIFALKQGKEKEVWLKDFKLYYVLGIDNTTILITFS